MVTHASKVFVRANHHKGMQPLWVMEVKWKSLRFHVSIQSKM